MRSNLCLFLCFCFVSNKFIFKFEFLINRNYWFHLLITNIHVYVIIFIYQIYIFSSKIYTNINITIIIIIYKCSQNLTHDGHLVVSGRSGIVRYIYMITKYYIDFSIKIKFNLIHFLAATLNNLQITCVKTFY